MIVLITCIYGLYALPRMIGVFKVENKTDNKFFEGLFKYALGGIILIITICDIKRIIHCTII